jgi:hypothetical protein
MTRELDYHSLMNRLDEVLRSGALGPVELAHCEHTNVDQPFWIMLRDRLKHTCGTGELRRNGTVAFGDIIISLDTKLGI